MHKYQQRRLENTVLHAMFSPVMWESSHGLRLHFVRAAIEKTAITFQVQRVLCKLTRSLNGWGPISAALSECHVFVWSRKAPRCANTVSALSIKPVNLRRK